MNNVRQIQELNKRELEAAISTGASWHADYRDTAWIYIGGLPFDLNEGDVLTVCSQYGNPSAIDLTRDKDSGKSRGFAFVKYDDQRSTDLAVDNLGGAQVLGRTLRVDHTRYERREDKGGKASSSLIMLDEVEDEGGSVRAAGSESEDGMEEQDPMKDYLVEQRRRVIEEDQQKKLVHRHHHRHHHRSSKSHRDQRGEVEAGRDPHRSTSGEEKPRSSGQRYEHPRRHSRSRTRSRSRSRSIDRARRRR